MMVMKCLSRIKLAAAIQFELVLMMERAVAGICLLA